MRIKIDIDENGMKYDFSKMDDFTGDARVLVEFAEASVDKILAEARRLNALSDKGERE